MKRFEPDIYKQNSNFTIIVKILRTRLKLPTKPVTRFAQVGAICNK